VPRAEAAPRPGEGNAPRHDTLTTVTRSSRWVDGLGQHTPGEALTFSPKGSRTGLAFPTKVPP
jgi:hypothetical protein